MIVLCRNCKSYMKEKGTRKINCLLRGDPPNVCEFYLFKNFDILTKKLKSEIRRNQNDTTGFAQ